MFKKRIWIPIFIGLGWVTCLGGLVVLMSFIEIKKAAVLCTSVNVYMPGNQYFIDKQEVDNILELNSNTPVGRKLESINLHDLETRLKSNPFIEFAKVYADMDGIIQVEISQRQPILRVMNRFDQDYYIDQHGLKIPLSNNFTAKVLAANGFIDEVFGGKVDTLHTQTGRDLYKTANFIRKDSLWSAQIAQLYINTGQEIELIPRVGNHRILLGNADSLQVKFNNLYAFYKQALPTVGWDKYKTIVIKYSGQVVGIKNDNLKKDSTKVVKKDSSKMIKDTSIKIKH